MKDKNHPREGWQQLFEQFANTDADTLIETPLPESDDEDWVWE